MKPVIVHLIISYGLSDTAHHENTINAFCTDTKKTPRSKHRFWPLWHPILINSRWKTWKIARLFPRDVSSKVSENEWKRCMCRYISEEIIIENHEGIYLLSLVYTCSFILRLVFFPTKKAVGIQSFIFLDQGFTLAILLVTFLGWWVYVTRNQRRNRRDLQRGPGIKRSRIELNHLVKPVWNKTPPPFFVCSC